MNPGRTITLSALVLSLWSCQESPSSQVAEAVKRFGVHRGESRLLGQSFEYDEEHSAIGFRKATHDFTGRAGRHTEALALWMGWESSPGKDVRRSLNDSDLDLVLGKLHDLVREAPNEIGPANDLAAIYLTAAQELDRPAYFLAAFEVLAPFLATPEPPPEEVLWNAALLFERLTLYEEAHQAWEACLDRNGDSPFRANARQHLASLLAPKSVVHQLPFVRRGPVSKATNPRERVADMANWLEAAEPDDLLFRESARIARNLLKQDDSAELQRFAEAYEKLELAYQLYQDHKSEEAVAASHESSSYWTSLASPLALWADFVRVLVDQAEDRLPEASTTLTRLRAELATWPSPPLRDYAEWIRGLLLFRQGRPLEAIEPYQNSLHGFSSRGDFENAIAMERLLGEALFSLGRDEEAFKHLLSAPQDAPQLLDPRRALIQSLTLGETTREAGYSHISYFFQFQAFQRAAALGNPRLLLIAASELARLQLSAGKLPQARLTVKSTRDALEVLDSRPRPRFQDQADADLAAIEALLPDSRSTDVKIAALGSALAFYENAKMDTTKINDTLEARAELHLRRKSFDSAVADLEKSLELFESRLRHKEDAAILAPASARRRARETYLRLVDLMLDAGREEEAYAWAVRARAHSLSSLDAPHPGTGRDALSLSSLPGKTALVHYLLTPKKVVIFIRDGADLKVQMTAGSPAPLLQKVQRFRAALLESSDLEGAEELARELYLALLAPVDRALGHKPDLLIVAGDELGSLPFAALIDPVSRKFVIQERSLLHAPSEGAFEKAQTASRRWRSEGKKVALANPATELSWLRDLPGALHEGQALQKIFPDLLLAEKEAATRTFFRKESVDATLIVLAAHSLTSTRNPAHSVIFLAKEKEDPGFLYQSDLYRLRLDASPLVVLSACGTGKPTGKEAPPSSLATGFLAAGASAVIAPLFDVNDRATPALMKVFYRKLAAGQSPGEALRSAQVAYLANSRAMQKDPWLWSYFMVHGASR